MVISNNLGAKSKTANEGNDWIRRNISITRVKDRQSQSTTTSRC